jgi:deoxyhypusine synthase
MAETLLSNRPPPKATEAVLTKSEEMPKDASKVEELDFNKITGPVTAEHLLQGMKHMGFQATAMSEAIRIINDMVSREWENPPPMLDEADYAAIPEGMERI